MQAAIPQFGKGNPPCWFRSVVANPASVAQSFVAEIDYSFLDDVQFFLVDSQNRLIAQSKSIGWSSPLAERPDQHRNVLFHFALPAHQSHQLYVRVFARANRLSAPLRIWTAGAFSLHDRADRTRWGWISGIFGCIVFVGGLLWLLLREQLYGYYALYALTSWLYLVSIEGYPLEWIDRPDYGIISAVDFRHLWNYGQAILGFIFIRWYILPVVMHLEWVKTVYRTALSAVLVNVALLIFDHFLPAVFEQQVSWIAPLISINYFSSILTFVSLVVWIAFRPASHTAIVRESARMYLLATTPLLLLTAASMLRNYNLIPDHFLLRPEGNALAIVFEFITLSIGLGYRYKRIADDRQRLTNETHRQQQQAVEAQLQLQQQELRALAAQLQLQREKERIARDLHDNVGSQLSVIASTMDHVSHQVQEHAIADQVTIVGNFARDAIQSLRDTIWAIHHETITLPEFRVKLQQYIHRQQAVSGSCQLLLNAQGPPTGTMSSLQALNLFRIIQEALHNALKYAESSEIVVSYRLDAHVLYLTITDNGRGFCTDLRPDNEPHYGLQNMQHRANELNGHCSIRSQPGAGTIVDVVISLDGSAQQYASAAAENTSVAV